MDASPSARALGVVWQGIQPAGDLQNVANRFSTAYGVGTDGAVLIRPDGFIAWRHANQADAREHSTMRLIDCRSEPQ
jgi:hypothetical protein